jgi:hypothetical protein
MNNSREESESIARISNETEKGKPSVLEKTDHAKQWGCSWSMLRWPFHNPFECVEFIPVEYSDRLKDLISDEEEQDNKTGT